MNLNTIIEFSSGDLNFVRETVLIFIKESKNTLTQLKNSCKAKDWNKVNRLAHSLKSNYATFEMQELRTLAFQIEKDTKDAKVDTKKTMKMIATLEQKTLQTYPLLKNQLMKLKK